ncbi:MAG: type I DNA topoisomerase [Actinomycetota bacterium]|nr:type I DNA topoisomerase [Actinomycetota bacterium]
MASTASGRPLVIVESPAKAKTISRFLGDEFDVRASVGHVADLPSKGLAVDVDNGFKPTYELTERGKQVVRDLRAALKDASELYLATDEDREGEAISWHLLEYLKPKVPVKRMVFHEITRAAIDHAVENPRSIDYGLVDAAETRRILDRLYGYEVSPILWRKVNRGLSAGRVQSPTIRLIVERERERIAFISAGYWDLELLTATAPAFTARLLEVDGVRVATGRDFDAAGRADERVRVLDEAEARRLASGLSDAEVSVRSVEEKPYRSSPKAPFMTSTLQQEAGRRLRLSSSQVMRLAQGLYEQGFITYMRTDNVVLSGEALSATRAAVEAEYGASYLSDAPKQYSSKSKNAQEAHEAIRPTTPYRSPKSVSGEIRDRQQLALYTLIWQRTLASQMADARGVTVSVRIGGATTDDGTDCLFAASGTTITFPGHRAVLDSAPSDGDEQSGSGDDVLLPELAVGDRVPVADLTAEGHSTSPPARFTEASLVKRLEELGIGRPSTWASIIQTVQDRGYVWKKGQALVPTWTAFAVVGLLEQHFDDLVDYELTAKIEEDLDGIADGSRHKDEWLQRFYFGADDLPGLKTLVEENLDQIDAAKINTFPIGLDEDGNEVVAKPGRYGPYVKRGEDTASIPDTLAPDELTIAEAIRLLSLPKSDEPIGELDGLPVFAKNGRYGPYVQWGTPDAPPPGVDKPRMTSLFATMSLEHITMEDAERLLTLPRVLGIDPNDGEEIRADNGRYGPYVVKGRDFRSIDSEDQLLTISLDEAVRIFELPKVFKRAGRSMAASGPLREFGDDPVSGRKVVARDGRFGVYVTDGETNASIGKGDRIEDMLPERAFELLAIRREQAPNKKTAKRAAPKKAAAKKTSKKAGAKKSVARKSSAKKAGAKRASGDAD